MRRTEHIIETALVTILVYALATSDVVLGQTNTRMDWYGTSGGFGPSSFANTRLTMDIGQSFVGRSAVSNTVLQGGFLVHPCLIGPLVSVPEQEELPATYDLFQNYPNPFNPSTTITYALPAQSHVVLTVYNLLGQKVVQLVDEMQEAGMKSMVWDGQNSSGSRVASGIYLFRLNAMSDASGNQFTQVRKMMVVK